MGVEAPRQEAWVAIVPEDATASSWLRSAYNQHDENYHPRYVLDDDPRTTWTEGVSGQGEGEWLTLHLTPISAARGVRLRIRNGYQKSEALLNANAALDSTRVTLLSEGGRVLHAEQITLQRAEGWQELVVSLPSAATVAQVKIEALSAHPGETYADLCISDVRVWVDADDVDPGTQEQNQQATADWIAARQAEAAHARRGHRNPFAGHTVTRTGAEEQPRGPHVAQTRRLIRLLREAKESGELLHAEATYTPTPLRYRDHDLKELMGLEYLFDLSRLSFSETTEPWRNESRPGVPQGRSISYTRSNVRVLRAADGSVSAVYGEFRFQDWETFFSMRGGAEATGRQFVLKYTQGKPTSLLLVDHEVFYGEVTERSYEYSLCTFSTNSAGQIVGLEIVALGDGERLSRDGKVDVVRYTLG